MAFENITKKRPPKSTGGSRSQVFRTALYTYGKRSGTIKVLPGVKNTGAGQFLSNSRRKVYPLARALGTFEAARGGNFVAQMIGRASRIGTGSISGRLIDQVVRPFGLPPFIARQARVQLGKRLSRETKVDKMIRQGVQISFSHRVKVDGPSSNALVQTNLDIQKEAQLLLNMIETKLRAYAPDVSSGQYIIGTDDKRFSGGKKLINESAMLNQDRFNEMGIKNFAGGNKFIHRDVFGFEKPGQARTYLLASIDKKNVKQSQRNKNDFFYGEIDVGGSPLFPWIHAIEYGGKLPYYRKTGYGSKNSPNKGYKGHFMDAAMLENRGQEDIVKLNKGEPMNKYVPDFKYVPPTMFIYRSAMDGLSTFRKFATIDYLGDIDKGSTRYYNEWQQIAKRKNATAGFFKDETSYTKPGMTKSLVDDLYRMDQESSRQANFWSRMENKIPGPRVEMAHGNFYSQELAGAIGLENIPESFQFRANVLDLEADGGQPHSAKFLSELAKTYVRTGGSKNKGATIKAMNLQIMNDRQTGNFLRSSGLRGIKQEKRLGQLTAKGVRRNKKDRGKVFGSTTKSSNEALRLYNYFKAQESSQGSMRGERGSKYIKAMYDIRVRREGNKRIVYSTLKKSAKVRRTKDSQSNYDSIAGSTLSALELDEIFKVSQDIDI